jgi:hypothetical protein
MTKFSSQEQSRYREKIKKYGVLTETVLAKEKKSLEEMKQNPETSALTCLALSEDMLNLASYYITQNGISQSILKTRNEEALNEARKSVYKSVGYLEQVVTTLLDVPYVDYGEKIEKIAPVNAQRRYFFIRKMGFAISLLKNALGENSRWKWVFVELEGRYATAAKNIIDLKKAVSNADLRSPNYAPTVYHLRLIIKLLMQSADRYRERYELSTNKVSDFETGINFLYALRRIHLILGDREKAWDVKRKLDTWEHKLKMDVQRSRNPKAPAVNFLL